MKFRLSVQPKPTEFKSIVPSHLRSDPAFSVDPRLNPYSFTNQEFAWASPPPGHPVLKNKNRGPVVTNFASHHGITASADFDFQLIQPPNSPVSYIGGTPSFPFPTTLNAPPSSDIPPTAAEVPSAAALSLLDPLRQESPGSTTCPQPPAAKEGKKNNRMTFLSRRKTVQAAPSIPVTASGSSTPKDALISYENRVARAPSASRAASETIISVPRDRPVLPPRATTSSTATPRSTATSTSAASKRMGDSKSSRTKELDRIDELDETSPFSLSLHHDGPYEAAAQALKKGISTSLGRESRWNDHAQEMRAYGSPYVPPQAPIGVSLNLSPGQILPRNFSDQRVNSHRMRDTSALPPRMQQAYPQLHPSLSRSQSQLVPSQASSIPPRHLSRMDVRSENQSDSSRNRRQSQPPLSPGFGSPLPNPHPVLPRESRLISRMDITPSQNQSPAYLDLPLPPNPQSSSSHHSDSSSFYQPSVSSRSDSNSSSSLSRRHTQQLPRSLVVTNPGPESPRLTMPQAASRDTEPASSTKESPSEHMPFDIGMAMLNSQEVPETPVIPTPRIFLPHGTPDPEEEFNPYDPIHLENEHSRTPSPLALMYDSSSHSSHELSGREPSRQQSPVHSLEVPTMFPPRPIRSSEGPIQQKQKPLTIEGPSNDPPPYTVMADETKQAAQQSSHFRIPAQTQASSSNISLEWASSRKSSQSGPSEESHHSHHSIRELHAMVQAQAQDSYIPPVSQQQNTPQQQQPNQIVMTTMMTTQNSRVQDIRPPLNDERQGELADPQILPMLPARRSRERLVPPTISISERERDGRSTHQSISTASSGRPRNGPPPPHRYVPKHLVMPAPLQNANNNNNANSTTLASPHRLPSSLQSPYMPQRQIPPRRAQVTFVPHAQVHYPPPNNAPLPPLPPPSTPTLYVPPVTKLAQDIPILAGRKLRKRTSVVAPPSAAQIPSPPMVTTVSFVPPVIGYGTPAPGSKAISRLKNEKIPKRVLSKRRTDI